MVYLDNKLLYNYKIIIVGNSGVGKTSIACKYTGDENLYTSTIGIDFLTKTVKIGDDEFSLNILDTAGLCRFRSITKSFLRSSSGAVVVYDVANRKSFEDVKLWIDLVRDNLISPILLIGNKTDICSRAVSLEEGALMASKEHCMFFEVSADLGTNVDFSINSLLTVIHNNTMASTTISTTILDIETGVETHSKIKQRWCSCYN